jgi:hypothetical protein
MRSQDGERHPPGTLRERFLRGGNRLLRFLLEMVMVVTFTLFPTQMSMLL